VVDYDTILVLDQVTVIEAGAPATLLVNPDGALSSLFLGRRHGRNERCTPAATGVCLGRTPGPLCAQRVVGIAGVPSATSRTRPAARDAASRRHAKLPA
jgi:hypothetical protein